MNFVDFSSYSFSDWLGIVGLIVGVFGVLVAIWSKRERKPCCFVYTNNIIADAHDMFPGLRVHFSGYGQDLTDFTISKLVFWNKGQETIRKEDVASADPLRISAKSGVVILSANILHQSHEANRFRISNNSTRTEVALSFEYVDNGQFVVVEIAHTGTRGRDLSFEGTVKGAGRVRRISGTSNAFMPKNKRRVMWLLFWMSSMLLGSLLCMHFYELVTYPARLATFELENNVRIGALIKTLNDHSFNEENIKRQAISDRTRDVYTLFPPLKPRFPFLTTAVYCVILGFQAYTVRRIVPKGVEMYLRQEEASGGDDTRQRNNIVVVATSP